MIYRVVVLLVKLVGNKIRDPSITIPFFTLEDGQISNDGFGTGLVLGFLACSDDS